MDSATNFKEPPPAMSPPLIRPSARSQVQAPEGTGHDSRPQSRRLEYRSRSVKNRREIDVVIPPLETPHDFRPERVITDDKSAEADPRPTPSTNAGQTTVQEVHKIILSGISTVEFIHTKDSQIPPDPQPVPIKDASGGVKDNQNSAEKTSPKCLYRVEYRDEDDVLVGEKEGDIPAEVKIPDRNEAVMDVVTTFSVKRKYQSEKSEFDPALAKATNLGTEVRINSTLLANALRAVVTYYPGQSLLEEPLVFESPYQLLFHYRRDLENYKDNHPDKHDLEYRQECNQHIDILLDFLHHCLDGDVDKEEARNQQSPPMCTFEYLWTILRPGVDIYTRDCIVPLNSPRSVYVVSSIEGGPTNSSEILPYKIRIWNIQSDGETLRRCSSSVDILPFDGEKEIRSLEALPLDFLEEVERKALEDRLIARGKRYYDYTSISHKHFHGYTMHTPRRLYDVAVMLDTAEYFLDSQYRVSYMTFIDEGHDKSIGVWGCGCSACRKTKNTEGKVRFSAYDRIPLKKSATKELSDHQCLVCPPKIFGYALKQRAWQTLDMDAIEDMKFDKDAINDLILDPEENKGLLKALASRYTQKPADDDLLPATIVDGVTVVRKRAETWTVDSVEGKGEGQIILLHGPPGVGKTCTAETVAEFTERPLLSLTCSDIGTRAEEVELNLRLWMKKARRWGAILLIDEADVYLEERSTQAFERNSLVSVFLRNLEYYQGILFLTTNRVGVFDEAFTSRIHITMWYPGFDDARRVKVWKAMIAKLARERKDIKIPYDLNKYIEKDEDLRKVEWNGREIRNAFQTTVALAEFQASEEKSTEIELKIDYLDQVVKMSKRFKAYLDTMPDGNVAKKAWRYGKRNDQFDST